MLEVLRSGRLSLGPMGEFERDFADWLGGDDAVAVSSGTAALHLGVRALGWGEGDEVLTSPFSFVASANCLLYEGARPVFCDIDPVTLNLDPAAAARGARRAHRRASCRSTSSATRPTWPRSSSSPTANGLGILEDACQALGAVDAEGRRVGARGNLATFAFYANKQMTTGEGGVLVPSCRGGRGAPAQRAQPGPCARTWAGGPRPPGLQLPAHRPRGRDRHRPGRAARRDARARATRRRRLRRAPGRARARSRPRSPAAGEERRSWFVYPVRLAAEVDRDAAVARLAERGVACKAYLPCIHLFPHLRELGYRGASSRSPKRRPRALSPCPSSPR